MKSEKSKTNYIQTGLRVPKKQYERIKKHAEKTGTSFNGIMSECIEIGLNHLEQVSPRVHSHKPTNTV